MSPAWAEPVLQLDIANGTYDPISETIVAATDAFPLFTLLSPPTNATSSEINAMLASTYYVAVALVPQTGPVDQNLGSYTFNGNPVSVTSDMTYGTPPLELLPQLQGSDAHDLSSHGIYETFFTQVPFTFSSSQRATTYNTADSPGGLVVNPMGGSYYAAFAVNMLQLDPRYTLHFDLYDTTVVECAQKKQTTKKSGPQSPTQGPNALCPDVDVDSFAPFSHDAQGPPDREPPPPPPVPEAPSIILFAASMGAAGVRRWLRGR